MSHFTYLSQFDSDNLYQGDLIKRTEKINEITSELQPQFHDELNVYFALITQSCDLVRRENEDCKAKQLTFAVVRTLDQAIETEAGKYKITKIQKKFDVFNESSKNKILQFVERLLNNNESKYFFYAKDIDFELPIDYCAQLEFTFSVDSKKYYDIFLEAKFIQLNDSFQHKLGYLVGNNFMKIGTEDWVPKSLDKSSFDKKRNDLSNKNRYFVDNKIMQALELKLSDKQLDQMSTDEFDEILKNEENMAKKQKEEVFAEIQSTLAESIQDNKEVERIIKKLRNNPKITSRLK